MDTIKEVESARNVLNRREEMLDDSTLQAVREAAVRQKDLANIGNLDTDLNNLYTKAKTAHSNWTSGLIDTNTFLSEYDSIYKEARKLSNVLNRVSLYTDDAGDYVKQTKDSLAQVISSVYSANLSLKKDGKVLFNNYADVQKAEEEYKSYLYEESEYEEYKNAMKERERILEYYKSQSSEMLTEEQWRGKAHDMIFFSKYPTYQAYLDAYRKGEVQAEVEKRQAYATEYDNKLSAITNKGKYATTSQQGDMVYNRADWYGRYQYETLYELYGGPEYEQTVEEGKKLSSGYKVDEKDIKAPMSTEENLERLNALRLQSKYANTDVQYINPQYADMYYYLLAAQGPEAANEYLSNFEGYINYLKGYIRAEDMKDAGMIRNAVLDVQAGLNGFFRGIETFLFPGDYNPRTSSEIAFAAHREDRSWIGRLAGDVLMNIAQNAPSQLLSAAGFKALGYTSFFATAAGNAYTTAQELGATTEQASAYSMIIGASETLLEKLLSGLEYTGGALKNAIFGSSAVEFAETTGQALWNVAKNYGANVLGEFTEEYLQEVLEPVFRNICFDENNEFKFFTVDALYAGIIGALSAASQVRNIRGFASDMNQAVYFAKTGQEFLKYEDTTQLIDNAMKLGGEVAEYARNLPENPTAYQIGTLAAMSGQQRTQLGMVHQLFESIGYKVKIVDTLTPAKMETKRGKKSQQTINTDEVVNGEIDTNTKTVTLARDATKLLQWTAKHEVMHSLEGTSLYAKLKESILTSKHLSDILSQNGLTVEEAINGYAGALTRKTGKEYTYEQAEKEFLGDYVAVFLFNREDYARELVGVYAPLGQKISQALGNVRKAAFGSKEERYFAQAQNTFIKAMEQVKEIRPNDTADAVKTNETQESISSFFDALGIEVSPVGKYGISVSEKVTPEIVENSNLGKVLNYAVKQGNITQADKAKQVDFIVQLSNMIRESPSPRMLWEFIGSNAFSAITANSDPQYVSTIDFGTVCVKTQELINKMSKAMVEKAKRNNGFGALTKEEITALYNETGRQGYLTNCPQCYVFQRWVGLGSRLNDVTLYQKKYGSLTYDECEKIVRQVDAWMDNAEEIIGQKLSESANVKEKLIQYFERNGRSDDAELVRAFSWFTGTRVNRKNNKGKISYSPYAQNKNGFEVVPAEILYDYNAGDAFVRKYPLTWKYRTSGGSAYGKAIQPYTEMTLGEVARGVSNTEDVVEKNAKKFTYDDPRALKSADKNVRSQNLRGGQRMNSTSDFMYAHGLDYLLALMELQALGSNVQLYTKVTESLPMLCAAGADCNISVMPEGKGYIENGDGTYKLQLSSIQGVDPNTANAIARMYANAQLIMVGINDIAIKLALSGDAITFVIPYHASGGEAAFVTALMNALGEAEVDKNFIYDYTKMQSDHILTNYKAKYSNLSDAEIETLKERHSRLRKIREGIINGKAIVNGKRNSTSKQGAFALTADDLSLIFDESQNGRPYIEQLLIRYYGVNSMLQEVYSPDVGVVMKDKSAEQIFPYEYWDTTSTIDTADINGVRFVEYCESLGIVPRFSGMDSSGKKVTKVVGKDRVEHGNFAYEVQEDGSVRPTKGYWKLLIDRPMYNIAYDAKGNPVENFGAYRNQQKINITNIKPQMFVPEFEMTEANRKRYFVQADTQNADLGNFYSTMDTYYGVVNAFAAAKNKQSNPYDRFNLQNELNNLGYSSTYDIVNQISAGKAVLDPADKISTNSVSDESDIQYSIGDMSFEQMLAEIANEYGKMPPPNQPKRDVVYPKEVSVNGKKRRVSRFAQTGASNTSEGTGEEVARRVLSGEATYTPTSNAANMSSAEYLRKGFVDDDRSTGYEKALGQVDAQTNINYMPTAQDIAFAELMIMEADNMGDSETASRLIAQTAVLATRAGQAVQALSLIKKLGNQGRLYVLEQQINNINRNLTDAQRKTFVNDYIKEAEGLAKELLEYRQKLQEGSVTEEDRKSIMKKVTETLGKANEKADVDTVDQVTELIERLTAKLTEEQKEAVKKNGGVKLSEETKKKILDAKTPQELEDAVLNATKEIGMQIPATFRDKWNAWRYMAMLVNPVTHLRNTISNAFMVPLAMSQNTISRALGNTDRSVWLKKEYKDAAERIMKDNAFKKLMDGNKYDEATEIFDNQKIFNNKVLEWIRKVNGNFLSKEDVFFKKIYFKRALAGYMQRHNIAADTKIEHLTRALEYAANEANVNTFNNESKLANDINKFAKGGSWAREFAINGIIPFKRTPINILKQSINYSPLGFGKVAMKAAQYRQGNATGNDIVDTLASSLTGTALSMVGAWMYLSGALTLGLGDDKDDEFAKLQGVQKYSLRIGDKYFSIDWLAPSAVPVFLGAELARFIFENTDGTPDELWSALKRTVTPVLEMSMLQGIQNTLDSLSYGQKGEKIQDALASIFESYLSQAIPTFFGKVNNILNDTQKMGYADKNSPIPTTVQKFLQKIAKKVPYFGKYSLTDYLDRWGREVSTGNVLERIAENFVFPGYISEENTSDMEKELQRLYDSTGKKKILPGANDRSTTIKTADGSHEIQFTADEYRAFNMARKGMAYNALTELTDSDYYKSLDDEEKVKAINFVWDATLDIAKVGVAYSRGLKLDMEKATQALEADEGMDLIMYYRIYNAGTTQDARRQAMSDLGLTDKQKEKLWKVLYPNAATDYKGDKVPKEQRGNK